jgi:hypothetical protein
VQMGKARPVPIAAAFIAGSVAGLTPSAGASAHDPGQHGFHANPTYCHYSWHKDVSAGWAEAATRGDCAGYSTGVRLKWQDRFGTHSTGNVGWVYENDLFVVTGTYDVPGLNSSYRVSNSDHYYHTWVNHLTWQISW